MRGRAPVHRYLLAFPAGVVFSLYWFPAVPAPQVLCGLLMAALIALLRFPTVGMLLLGGFWALFHAYLTQQDQLDPTLWAQSKVIDGAVVSIPEPREGFIRFHFRPLDRSLPRRILVRWYRDWPEVKAGQQWRLQLKLAPPRGRVNFNGFDFEKWLFAQKIGALGSVKTGTPLRAKKTSPAVWLLRIREHLAAGIQQRSGHNAGLLQALAVGERSRVSERQWELLRATGTSHLVAISGLHIGLVAGLGLAVGRLAFSIAPYRLLRLGAIRSGVLLGMAAALGYAALAGFVVPTRRALLMLLIGSFGLLTRRHPAPWLAWRWALFAVLLVEPMAPLRAGFWLSFGAVAVLIYGFSNRGGGVGRARSFARAQWLVIVGTLPLSLWWFNRWSPAAWPANALAVPLFSLLTVPAVIGALLFWPVAGISTTLLRLADRLLDRLLWILDWLDIPPLEWYGQAGWPTGIVLALATAAVLAPRGWPGRIPAAVCVLLLWASPRQLPAPGHWELHLLDSGQGLAALVRTRHHLLLYDTGPGNGQGRDLVDSTLVPAIRAYPGSLNTAVVSHQDLDHAGGVATLMQHYPDLHWLISGRDLRQADATELSCDTRRRWRWDGVSFRVVHPSPYLPYLGNDSSCVVAIGGRKHSLLLPGDISAVVEARLASVLQPGAADLLIVPHHGSETSSSGAFIDHVAPSVAAVSVAASNRFGLPSPVVTARYRDRGVYVPDTAACGAIKIRSGAAPALQVSSVRKTKPRLWRFAAAGDCGPLR